MAWGRPGKTMIEDTFTAVVAGALARSDFVPPAANEARTIVFACEALAMHVPVAALMLDAGESRRAGRFRFEHDRARYTLAHATWRVVLSACLGVAPSGIPLTTAPSGQPTLPGTGFSTSLSHAGDWVAVAVCRGATTGIDIERIPSRVRLAEMIDTVCTPAEARRISLLDASARESALLGLWTRKEALLKAFGVGLAVDPAAVDAATDGLVAPPPVAGAVPACWVGGLDLPEGLIGALAIPDSVIRVEQHRLAWG